MATLLPALLLAPGDGGTLCPADGLTTPNQTDGLGSHIWQLTSCYATAKQLNRTFCYTPWSAVDHHNGTDGPVTDFEFVGGPYYGPPADNHSIEQCKWTSIMDPAFTWPFNFTPGVLQDIRRFYSMSPRPKPAAFYFDSANNSGSNFTVAWHVRRGDLETTARGNLGWRPIVSNANLTNGLAVLGRLYADRIKKIHIFSDAAPGELDGIADSCAPFRCEVHLESDLQLVFHHLVTADVLVRTTSSFSVTATIFNTNGHIYVDSDLAQNLTTPRLEPWVWA